MCLRPLEILGREAIDDVGMLGRDVARLATVGFEVVEFPFQTRVGGNQLPFAGADGPVAGTFPEERLVARDRLGFPVEDRPERTAGEGLDVVALVFFRIAGVGQLVKCRGDVNDMSGPLDKFPLRDTFRIPRDERGAEAPFMEIIFVLTERRNR